MYGQHFPSTLLRCKKSVISRVTIHLKHCHATKFCCCKLKKFVEFAVQFAATCCFNLQQRNFVAWRCLRWVVIRATTLFNFATQHCCVASCSNLLFVLLHLTCKSREITDFKLFWWLYYKFDSFISFFGILETDWGQRERDWTLKLKESCLCKERIQTTY